MLTGGARESARKRRKRERERGWAGPEEKVGPAGKGKQAGMGWVAEKKKKRKGEKEMCLLG